jgi:hypothetical protein
VRRALIVLALVLSNALAQGILPQEDAQAVVTRFLVDAAAGRTEAALTALDPSLASGRGLVGGLRGATKVAVLPFREILWLAQEREYKVSYDQAGKRQWAFVLLRQRGTGPWAITSWSATPTPRLGLDRQTLRPRDTATVRAYAFPPGTQVQLILEAAGHAGAVVAEARVDGAGRARLAFRVPASLAGRPLLARSATLIASGAGAAAARRAIFEPAFVEDDLDATLARPAYQVAYPAALEARVREAGGFTLHDPAGGEEAIAASELTRPEKAASLTRAEYVLQFGPLNVEGAIAPGHLARFTLPGGQPGWVGTWPSAGGGTVGPLYLVPLDEAAQTWLMLRATPEYLPLLDAIARNLRLRG